MNEIFPIASGLIVGAALGGFAPRVRLLLGVVAAVVLGTLATIISGEYRISWEFLLVDIPLVGLSAAVGFLVSRGVRLRIVDRAVESD